MIKINKLNPFGRMCLSMGMIPSSYAESLTYEEQLLWFCNFLEKQVIPAVNTEGEAIEELQSLYQELKTYVDNYFENLDIQTEINNKLDEMAESGQLTDIIAEYLNVKALLCFNTVADMVAAENLIEGSYAYVYGHYSINDGGQAHYKIRTITNDDIVDGYTIIALDVSNTLIAELTEENVTLEMFGAYGDATHDDTEAFQRAVNYSISINLLEKPYLISDTINLPNLIQITGKGIKSEIYTTIDDGSSLFKLESNIAHFNFNNFYILGNGVNCIAFEILNPYDDCRIENIHIMGLTNYYIKAGNNNTISQSLLINNCFFYGSNSPAVMDKNLIYLEKVYECNLTNNKLLYQSSNVGTVPPLYCKSVYDLSATGNSFAHSSDCAIQFDGEAKYCRLISNTYENITGSKIIYFNGTNADDCQYNIILETNYYNAPPKVLMNNTVGNIIIGLTQEGGRRNFLINTKSLMNETNGNSYIFADGTTIYSKSTGFTDYQDNRRFMIRVVDSQYADDGLRIYDWKSANDIKIKPTRVEFLTNGYKIMLKSPDGTKTKYLSIDNTGALVVTDS